MKTAKNNTELVKAFEKGIALSSKTSASITKYYLHERLNEVELHMVKELTIFANFCGYEMFYLNSYGTTVAMNINGSIILLGDRHSITTQRLRRFVSGDIVLPSIYSLYVDHAIRNTNKVLVKNFKTYNATVRNLMCQNNEQEKKHALERAKKELFKYLTLEMHQNGFDTFEMKWEKR